MPTTDPSHASMFTGLHPRTHGIRQNGESLSDPGVGNLASWARALGYGTGAFVSRRHLVPSELGIQGFDREDGPRGTERDGAETVERALIWARIHAAEPFFLWIHLFDPHYPYRPPPPFADRFTPDDHPEPIERRNRPERDPYPPEQIALLVGLYDGEIAYVDTLVGRLFDGIRAALAVGSTPLFVVVGDHGEAMGELDERYRFCFDHGKFLYQGILQVPLLMHWEGELPAGRVVHAPVSLVDLAPTLFDLVGEPGFSTQGRSLRPAIEARKSAGRVGVVSERRTLRGGTEAPFDAEEQIAIQDDRYKLILSRPSERSELYDLRRDPREVEDLAAALPQIRDRLRAEIDRWLERTPLAAHAEGGIPREKLDALRALGYVE